MKIKTVLFALLVVVFVIGGCKTVDDLNEITFDANFKADLVCDVLPGSLKSDINGTYSASETIDPLADPNVEEHIDNIKSWNVVGVTAEIVSVSKPGVNLLNAEIKVFSSNHSAIWNIPGLPLTVGQNATLGNENGQWDEINAILAEKNVFTVSGTGTTDDDDFTFTVRVSIKTKVTAKVVQI
jgi:hypothetical protein